MKRAEDNIEKLKAELLQCYETISTQCDILTRVFAKDNTRMQNVLTDPAVTEGMEKFKVAASQATAVIQSGQINVLRELEDELLRCYRIIGIQAEVLARVMETDNALVQEVLTELQLTNDDMQRLLGRG